jgi:hypothetical protein
MTTFVNPNAHDMVIAGSPLTSPDLLRDYGDSKDAALRQRVAANVAVPHDVCMKLAGDKSVTVRCELARNPRIPYLVLKAMTNDDNSAVRFAVAECPYTPLPLLHRLEFDPNPKVQARAKRTLMYVTKWDDADVQQDFEPRLLDDAELTPRARYEEGAEMLLHDVRLEYSILKEQLERSAQEAKENLLSSDLWEGVQAKIGKLDDDLKKMKAASDEAWSGLKDHVDHARSELVAGWKHLQESLEKAASKLKNQ